MDDANGIEVVADGPVDAYGFTLKCTASGQLHRVLPARDPRQPRFWCVMVFRCTAGGLAEIAERPWVDAGGLRREDLREVMQAIRTDPAAWLAQAENAQVRRWMLAPRAEPAPAAHLAHDMVTPAPTGA